MNAAKLLSLKLLIVALFSAGTLQADMTDFTNWFLTEDPPHPGLTASATSTQATLMALNQSIPNATDIGYTSANPTSGYVFDPFNDFSVAITYDMSFSGAPVGGLGLGFGIGEDAAGANSAGIGFVTRDDAAFLNFTGAGRVNNMDQPPMATNLPATLTGTMFVTYDASTGDVIVGASQTPDAGSADDFVTFTGIQNLWNDAPLGVSFFMRSQDLDVFGDPWAGGGEGTAIFTNFRVLAGTPRQIPEPNSFAILGLLGMAATIRRRRS